MKKALMLVVPLCLVLVGTDIFIVIYQAESISM